MQRTRRTGLSVLMSLALVGGLAACGDDSEETATSTSSSAESSSEDTASETSEDTASETSSETPEETSSSSESTSETSSSSSSAAADSGEKPPKQDVIDGYSAIVTEMMSSLPEDAVDQATTCLVDEIYDDASVQTLQALADSEVNNVNPDDVSLFQDAQTTCTESLSQG
ncbi:hypothetical protein GCM10027055_21490 [Janibacter alkaliphilus]|uniref:Cytoskeletal protein RodZ n=1 Tax=Janibacter alkaliphilus TaxID=1069963 RepID=A0A852XCV3_9MICO|nr:hypothetical protein [Janibacter alkaliphilus]NYG38543.1 cytoskeletal protein RodZ [Janibacter alkaliphilus]